MREEIPPESRRVSYRRRLQDRSDIHGCNITVQVILPLPSIELPYPVTVDLMKDTDGPVGNPGTDPFSMSEDVHNFASRQSLSSDSVVVSLDDGDLVRDRLLTASRLLLVILNQSLSSSNRNECAPTKINPDQLVLPIRFSGVLCDRSLKARWSDYSLQDTPP